MSLAPYTLPLSAGSALWMYRPARDAAAIEGWNASYTGSTQWPPSTGGGGQELGVGSQFFRTQNASASVSVDFTGTNLLLCFQDNGAAHTLRIDGRQVNLQTEENDVACRELGGTTTIRTGDLDFALHSVILDVNASYTQEFQFFGGVLQTKVAVDRDGEAVTEVMVDDRDDDWIMDRGGDNGWDISSSNDRAYNGTVSFICLYGPDMRTAYKFKGASAVIFYGMSGSGSHDFSILLDQTPFSFDASVSGWSLPSTVYFFRAGLDVDHEYTLTYRNFAEGKDCQNPITGSRYCCSTIDGFKLLGPASKLAYLLPPGSSLSNSLTSTDSGASSTGTDSGASPTNSQVSEESSTKFTTAAIAGGLAGGLAILTIILAAAFFALRRRRRQNKHRTQAASGSWLQLPGSREPTPSITHGVFGGDVAHETVSPFLYFPPTSSHRRSIEPPLILMSGDEVVGKRLALSTRTVNLSRDAACTQQVDRPFDLGIHAGDSGTIPPAYSPGQ